MSDWRVILHLTAAGIWLGCVFTEIAFERALAGPGQEARLALASLHRKVDLFVEVPAMTVVLLTGIALWPRLPGLGDLPVWFLVKLGLVAMAWIANAACVAVVLRRHAAARRSDMAGFESMDLLQHRLGALVLAGLVGGGACAAGPFSLG